MANRTVIVTVSHPVDVDLNVFSLWLKGMSLQGATRIRINIEPPVTQLFSDYPALLLAETEEMYRLFNSLEPYLQSPPTFLSQFVYQV